MFRRKPQPPQYPPQGYPQPYWTPEQYAKAAESEKQRRDGNRMVIGCLILLVLCVGPWVLGWILVNWPF